MAGGATFLDVLEQTLGASTPDHHRSGTLPGFRQAPPPSFFFGPPRFHFGSTPYAKIAVPRPADPRRAAAPRQTRRLTAEQQRALDALLRLGARLTPEFTARELKSAFRQLARRYHPDADARGTSGDKARLARIFAEMNDHHQQLLAVLAPAPQTM